MGRHLAKRLRIPFFDSDYEIEQRLGCSISEYFDREGEERFRDFEEAVIEELTMASSGVLSTGGGAVLRPGNRRHLRERGTVIYLNSSPEDIYKRLRHDTQRPLLQVPDPLAKLRDLYAVRDPLYREVAHFTVDTGRPSVATLVNMIVMQLELAGLKPQ